MEKAFHSLNQFSHRELYAFGLKILREYESASGDGSSALLKNARGEIDAYGLLVEKINDKSIALLLDDFEGRRYKIWEQIISFLDKQLQVQLSPFDKDWDGKTPQKLILKHIPAYNAAHFVLKELCSDFTYGGRKVYGYIHSSREMNSLIDAMLSVRAARAVESLGLEKKMHTYHEVRQAFDHCIGSYPDLGEIFDQLGRRRVTVCLGLTIMLHKLPRYARSYPVSREVTVKGISPLLVNRNELICDAQRLSFNDFSHQSLLILAQRMLDARIQRLEEGGADFPLASELVSQVAVYSKYVKTIFGDNQESAFALWEGQRYRLFELLVSTIENHMHGDARWSNSQWIRHGCSAEYEAAEYLLYDTCEHYNHDFDPEGNGHLCQSEVMDRLVCSWEPFEAQMALRCLDCLALYRQYRACAGDCESAAWKIDRRIRSGVTAGLWAT
ncbi:MAG: hypothetical protein ACOCW2_02615, partial [Chitinivibrionales bacterium]